MCVITMSGRAGSASAVPSALYNRRAPLTPPKTRLSHQHFFIFCPYMLCDAEGYQIAQFRATKQSSTANGADSIRAVDGHNDGVSGAYCLVPGEGWDATHTPLRPIGIDACWIHICKYCCLSHAGSNAAPHGYDGWRLPNLLLFLPR